MLIVTTLHQPKQWNYKEIKLPCYQYLILLQENINRDVIVPLYSSIQNEITGKTKKALERS